MIIKLTSILLKVSCNELVTRNLNVKINLQATKLRTPPQSKWKFDYVLWVTGQQTGLRSLAAISPGSTPGINFCQSPDTMVGFSITRAPSAKYVLARTIRLWEVLLFPAV